MADDSSIDNAEVFVYTDGVVVPEDVVRVRVHPSVTVIPEGAFDSCDALEEVELCEGLLEIGTRAFIHCNALTKIKIPSTVTRIFWGYFQCRQLEDVELCEGNLREISVRAFSDTNIKRIKIPSTVTLIDNYAFAGCYELAEVDLYEGLRSINYCAFEGCQSLKHITLPTTVTRIESFAFSSCKSLRDIAIPPNAETQYNNDNAFCLCSDLLGLFNGNNQIINILQHRFDNLPIHKMIYYQSCNNVTVDELSDATNMRRGQRRSLRSKLDPTGSQQDCLGMTPLHILACSSVHNIELYKVLVNKYPDNLVTEDKWEALPLLYAVWSCAPDEIVRYLVESYQSLYPNYEFDWTEMIATLSKAKVNNCVIQTLVDIQQEMKTNLDREEWIDGLANHGQITRETFRFLVQRGFTDRVNAIGLKQYRDEMMGEMGMSFYFTKVVWLDSVRSKLVKYEEEYHTLKEATTILELALWKNETNKSGGKKKRKRTEKSDDDFREQCRIGCKADIVIEHVLPFLMPSAS